MRKVYAGDKDLLRLMDHLVDPSHKPFEYLRELHRSSSDRYTARNKLQYYTAVAEDTPRVVIPTHNEMRLYNTYGCHESPKGGHLTREKTYITVSCDFYWTRQYLLYASTYVIINCVNGLSSALITCAITASVYTGRVLEVRVNNGNCLGLPKDDSENNRILVFVDRFCKMVQFTAVPSQ